MWALVWRDGLRITKSATQQTGKSAQRTMLAEVIQISFDDFQVEVLALEVERTFLEKVWAGC